MNYHQVEPGENWEYNQQIKSIDTEIKPVIPEPVVKKTFFEKAYETVKTFLTDWGINIGLFLFFGIVTAVIGEKIYRKIKHGI